jgi:AcrR family transcriptional regulator
MIVSHSRLTGMVADLRITGGRRNGLPRRQADEDVKRRLLDAVEHAMHERGLARVTTRDIAQIAGVAEGTMYNHFHDKSALLVAFLQREAPATMREAMVDLPVQVGLRSVPENLETVVTAVLNFHRRVAPIICSLLGDVSLMKAARRSLNERGIGPNLSSDRLAAYLAAEQRLGRVRPDLDVHTAVDLLLGASFKIAVADHLFGSTVKASKDRKQVTSLVNAFFRGLEPCDRGT